MDAFTSSSSEAREHKSHTTSTTIVRKKAPPAIFRSTTGTYLEEDEEEEEDLSFRFMDLPPEVRNSIYSFAFASWTPSAAVTQKLGPYHHKGTEPKHISRFALHPFTRVSRQIRKESVPVFFNDSTFIAQVQSNFVDRRQDRLDAPNSRFLSRASLKGTGVLNMKRPFKKLVRSFASAASMRDITFYVRRTNLYGWTNREPTVVSIQIRFQGKVGVEVVGRCTNNAPGEFSDHEKQDVDAVVEEVRDAAAKMGKRRHFKGFTINDVEKLAKALRFKPGESESE